MRLIFAADLHLMPSKNPDEEKYLRDFLFKICQGADALYLLGDVFHCWFEQRGKHHAGDYSSVLEIFREATSSGLQIYMVTGNRDFTADKNLGEISGIKTCSDKIVLSHTTPRMLLTHGDCFCVADKKYQFMRFLYNSPAVRKGWNLIPWKIAEPIAKHFQSENRCTEFRKPPKELDIQDCAVIRAFEKHNVDCIICGHVHYGDNRQFKLENNSEKSLYIIAPWCASKEYLVLDGNSFERHNMTS